MGDTASRKFRFRLVTFGAPRLEITDENGGIRVVGAGKPLALVTYLALSQRRSETREVLCDLLWGDRNPEQARPHLRQTLWLIKTQIGDSIINADGDSVGLSCDVETDVNDFLKSIEHGQLDRAIELYNGDFFSGYAAPGAGVFEEWANLERTRLRGRFVHAAEATGRRALNLGHFSEAIELGRRMRSVDSNGQAGWRLILEGRVAAGDLIGARADADQFEDWLKREEWELEPASAASIQLARKSATTIEEAPTQDLVAELVGRETQFSAIHDAWQDVLAGGTRLVHVSAEAGFGKTRLIRDILARIRAGRGRVRYVHANHGERGIPFSFASQIAESLSSLSGASGVTSANARTLVSLNPTLSSRYAEHTGSVEHLESLRVGIALLDLMSATADGKPVAIALDDLHWADQQSRDALRVVMSRIDRENVLLITTSRPHYGNVVTRSDVIQLGLSRLTDDDVASLVASLARLPDEEWATQFPSRLSRSANGQPLGILQTLRHSIDAGLLERKNEEWFSPDPLALKHAIEEREYSDQRLFFLNEQERLLLLTVSVAGVPIPRDMLVNALGHSASDLETTADSLELGGLLVAEDGRWLPAHDSIAEQLVSQSPTSEVKTAHRLLGDVMSRHNESSWRARSVRHLVAAERWKEASDAIVPIVRAQAGSSSKLRSTIQSLIEADDPRVVSRIVGQLPLTVRHPRLIRQAAVAGFAIATAIGVMAYASNSDKEFLEYPVIAVMEKSSTGGTDVRLAALDLSQWDPVRPLELRKIASADRWLGGHLTHATPRPGTNEWAVYRIYPDSGDGDIELISMNGVSRRLMKSHGDDRPMSFSPDGSQLLFLTTRWNRNGWSSLGVLDLRTGAVRKLSESSSNHASPSWSPDGTRVVYNRHLESEVDREICVSDADGSHAQCRLIPGWTRVATFGWLDDHRLLITGDTAGTASVVAIYDVDARSVARSDFPRYADVTLDASGAWALTRLTSTANPGLRISPATQFARSVAISSNSGVPTEIRFISPGVVSDYLDSIEVEKPRHIFAGIPHQLYTKGWSRSRRSIPITASRWRSMTPDIATIDSLGVLLPSRSGNVVVEFSAGGWRKVVDTLAIERQTSRIIVDEQWDRSAFTRWRRFGDPKPLIGIERGVPVFANNGDGNFFSGAYFNQPLNPLEGVSLDAHLSTPITKYQWQLIQVMLHSFSNANQIERWDHKTGYIQEYLDLEPGCAFQYPGGEGPEAITRASWYQSWKAVVGDSSSVLHKGDWYRVRLQIFPDGRCGVAINGHAVAISKARFDGTKPVLPIIQGSSADGKILVGRVMMRKGVPTDVNWSNLEFDGHQWARSATDRSRN